MKLEKETNYYIIKEWAELNEAEKEREIKKYGDIIMEDWYDYIYECYKDSIEEIKDRYKEKGIEFDYVYIDSNSQGWWIDKIKNLKVYRSIKIFGEDIEIDDVNIHSRKILELDDIYIYDYYIEEAKLKRIENTKKYKDFIASVKKDLEDMLEEINRVAKTYFEDEYNGAPEDFIDNIMEQNTYSFKITEETYNRLKAEGVE